MEFIVAAGLFHPCATIKSILSTLIDLYNGYTNFELRLITHGLFTQNYLFTDVLIPQHSIVIKQIIFYPMLNKGTFRYLSGL